MPIRQSLHRKSPRYPHDGLPPWAGQYGYRAAGIAASAWIAPRTGIVTSSPCGQDATIRHSAGGRGTGKPPATSRTAHHHRPLAQASTCSAEQQQVAGAVVTHRLTEQAATDPGSSASDAPPLPHFLDRSEGRIALGRAPTRSSRRRCRCRIGGGGCCREARCASQGAGDVVAKFPARVSAPGADARRCSDVLRSGRAGQTR